MINLLILSFIMSFSLSFSSNEKISGYVYDKNTSEFLCGVRVIIGTDTTYTNFDGYFEIKNTQNIDSIKLSLLSYNELDLIYNDKLLTINEIVK